MSTTFRSQSTATTLLDGKVLVVGGNYYGTTVANVDLYDPVTDAWTPVAPLLHPHAGQTATLLNDGRVYILGGADNGGFSNDAEIYDPAANIWTPAAPLVRGVVHQTATLMPDGRVLVVGGNNNHDTRPALLYDPALNTWLAAGTTTADHNSHTATLLNDGRVLVVGGNEDHPYLYAANTEIYDPLSNSWIVGPSLNTLRLGHVAALLPNGDVLVAGGKDYQGNFLASAEVYDPNLNAWLPTGTMSTTRQVGHIAEVLSDGHVLVAGGYATSSASSILPSAELYSSATGQWTSAGSMNSGRAYFASAILQDGSVLVVGPGPTAEKYIPAPYNNSPTIDPISDRVSNEGENLTFTVSVSDPDPFDSLTLGTANLPAGAFFASTTGTFSWTPTYDQAGTYPNVCFTATDNGTPVASTTECITITVNDVNRPPVLEPIGDKEVAEGSNITFTISASDPDGNSVSYSASNLPPGATFDSQTATFSWTPGYSQAGNYPNVEFTATDDGGPMELDVQLITITVGDVNRPPVFDDIPPQAVLEGQTLNFTVHATDPDNNLITLTAANLPDGATFDSQTGAFSWTPVRAQVGDYVLAFQAADDGVPSLTAGLEVAVTVGDNPTPEERAQDLVNAVVDYQLPTNIENSYLANLKKIAKFISESKLDPARNQLYAFIAKVNDDYAASAITTAERDQLLGMAQALLNAIQ